MTDMLFNEKGCAAIVLISCLAAKAFMSAQRIMILTKTKGDKDKANKLFKAEPFHSYHKSQMNDAEWAPIIIVTLFYAAAHRIDTGYGCTLAAIGSVVYVWGNLLSKGAMPNPVGALPRYTGTGMIAYHILDYVIHT